MASIQQKTQDWYKEYYEKKGINCNNLLSNSEVLFQHLGFESSIYSALQKASLLNTKDSKILDVGCGGGGSLTRFLHLGFSPENLFGIDILEERIKEAQKKYPNLTFICDDAANMPFSENNFDLTIESTMFVQITNEKLSSKIAKEMLRVTKQKGYILLIDWRYSKPNNPNYLGLSKKRIQDLFSVGSSTNIISQYNGALTPPVGRIISKYIPSIYFLLKGCFPFLSGQTTTLLQKL
jgi:ubiquinone/menaquinone biosynthesis C-methylase UbiE